MKRGQWGNQSQLSSSFDLHPNCITRSYVPSFEHNVEDSNGDQSSSGSNDHSVTYCLGGRHEAEE